MDEFERLFTTALINDADGSHESFMMPSFDVDEDLDLELDEAFDLKPYFDSSFLALHLESPAERKPSQVKSKTLVDEGSSDKEMEDAERLLLNEKKLARRRDQVCRASRNQRRKKKEGAEFFDARLEQLTLDDAEMRQRFGARYEEVRRRLIPVVHDVQPYRHSDSWAVAGEKLM